MGQEDDTHVIHGPAPLQPLPNITLGKLIYDSLLANPNKHEALIDAFTSKSISYKEILEKSCSLATSLEKSGYGRNTIVTVSSENNLEFFIPVISCLYIGAIVAPINHNYTEEELQHTLNISKPKIIFCSKAVSSKYIYLKNKKVNYIEKIIIIDSNEKVVGAETMDDYIEKKLIGFPKLQRFLPVDFDPSKQIAFIMCSSGTTGLPKGVMQTHTNLLVRYMHSIDPRYTNTGESFLGLPPFFHGFGFVTNLIALSLGQRIVVMKMFQEDVFLKAIQDYKISVLWLPPPLVILLAKSPSVDKYDLSCIVEVSCGAAPLSKKTEETVKKRLNIKTVRQAYGLTETTLAVTVVEIGDERHGSSGKPISYMSCKVRDPETGKSLGPGKLGELCCKGPMVMAGYYGNKEATRNAFTFDGWLLTGDVGYYDEEGYFFIVDRIKELIKYKAFQVAPAELEAILLSNPKVIDVGVVGLPDEEAGELPLAFVVKSGKVHVTEKELINFVNEKVSSQKRLRGGVIFVPAIPKNPSGKILRRELKKMISDYKAKL